MIALRRTWAIGLTVLMALAVFATPATSDEPQDPPPPDVQDPGWGGGAPGGGCGYWLRPWGYCPSGIGLFYECQGGYRVFVGCL